MTDTPELACMREASERMSELLTLARDAKMTLGPRQQEVLVKLRKKGPYFFGAHWQVGTRSATRKILDGLVAKGLVERCIIEGREQWIDDEIWFITFSGEMQEAMVDGDVRRYVF